MDRTEIKVEATPHDVWAVLADANTFADWVVGCKEVRDVEGPWPAVGAKIHHTVGVGPATLDDTTSVIESEPDRRLVLRARARPAGIAGVHLTLDAVPGGTVVVMEEEIAEGAASHVPDAVTDTLLHPRNVECLRRLKRLSEDRARATG
jgi:carbon monoxide dehydrogenase subunit G